MPVEHPPSFTDLPIPFSLFDCRIHLLPQVDTNPNHLTSLPWGHNLIRILRNGFNFLIIIFMLFIENSNSETNPNTK
jgi:hypothetical protein